MSYRSLSLGVFALVSLSACGASAPPRSAYASLPTTRGARQMVEMTDIEEVRDVLRTGSTTYVATDNGVLVFAGEGTPTRIGRAIATLQEVMDDLADTVATAARRPAH